MRSTTRILTTCLGLFAAVSISVAAPGGFGWRGSGGWAADGPYGRLFDPKTVTTVSGTITSLAEVTPIKGMGVGVHLILKTKTESVDVHLGPRWFLEAQDADLKAGDAIEVRGSRVQIEKKPAIIAIEVKRGEDVLVLRDAEGVPRWAGWRRGKRRTPPN